MIEGSGSESGSIPLTNGSGSRKPITHTDPPDPAPDPGPQLLGFAYNSVVQGPMEEGEEAAPGSCTRVCPL
jgi:hypothetical protein